jgi:hypothetical protein
MAAEVTPQKIKVARGSPWREPCEHYGAEAGSSCEALKHSRNGGGLGPEPAEPMATRLD